MGGCVYEPHWDLEGSAAPTLGCNAGGVGAQGVLGCEVGALQHLPTIRHLTHGDTDLLIDTAGLEGKIDIAARTDFIGTRGVPIEEYTWGT